MRAEKDKGHVKEVEVEKKPFVDRRAEALDFLLPVAPQYSLISVAEALIEAASDSGTSERVSEAVSAVSAWLTNEEQPPIDENAMAVYQRIRKSTSYLKIPDDPDFLEPILLVLYLRAKAALQTAGTKPFFGDLVSNLEKVKPTLDAMDPGVLGELLVETELRKGRSPTFSRALETAAEELNALIPELSHLEKPGQVLLRKPIDECSCVVRACRTTNGQRECRNACIGSWWECLLIFLGIILIIVLTA